MKKSINILLIEDNLGDARLLKEVLREYKIANDLVHIDNGQDALRYLYKDSEYASVVTPDLILLDLNLPGLTGTEVLAIIKNDFNLKDIPICILTASNAEKDIIKSYYLQANCYVVKPLDLEQFMTVVNAISDFWFNIVRLPKND